MFHKEQSQEFEHPSWQRTGAPFTMDPMTGCIDFREAHITLAPGMTEESFLRASGNTATIVSSNDGWHRYSMSQSLHDDQYLNVKVYFRDGRLKCISFAYISQDEILGAEWSSAREQERAAEFQKDLQQQLGKIGSFTWGSANAGFDDKGGPASIWMVYAG